MKPPTVTSALHDSLRLIPAEEGTDLSTFPDFLILGPQRTGSTWLTYHLQVHPEVFLPHSKELYYFSDLVKKGPRRSVSSFTEYLEQMRDSPIRFGRKYLRCLIRCGRPYAPKIRGEATASYATLPSDLIGELLAINPELKAILFLRDPIERAWSHAKKDLVDRDDLVVDEVEPEKFRRFFSTSGQMKRTLYSKMIENWRTHLKEGHLLVGEFSAIRKHPKDLLLELLKFLGVSSEERFLSESSLNKTVNPTRSAKIPDWIDEMLREEFQEGTEDYERCLSEVTSQKKAGYAVY